MFLLQNKLSHIFGYKRTLELVIVLLIGTFGAYSSGHYKEILIMVLDMVLLLGEHGNCIHINEN